MIQNNRKIRVLILVNELLRGGAQRIVADLACNFDLNKFEVSVVYLKSHKVFGSNQETLIGEFKDAGIQVTSLEGKQKFSFGEVWHLYKFIRQVKPDILHTFLPYSGVVGRIIGRLARVPIIIATQCNLPVAYDKRTYWIDRLTLFLATAWIGANEGIEISYGKSSSKFSVEKWKKGRRHFTIVAGVNLPHFDKCLKEINANNERAKLGIPGDATTVMMIARLIAWKGHDDLINSMQYLPKNIHLVLIGWGPMDESLQKLVCDLKIQERVHFLGARSDIMELLSMADIYAQTHKYNKEGNIWIGPNTSQMSGCAARIPSISTSVPMIELLIENEVTGVLAEPNNPKDIARAIQYLLDNPKEAHLFAQAARSRVEERYSVTAMVRSHQDLYSTAFLGKN